MVIFHLFLKREGKNESMNNKDHDCMDQIDLLKNYWYSMEILEI